MASIEESVFDDALNALSRGIVLKPLFHKVGVKTVTQLLAFDPSFFGTGTIDVSSLNKAIIDAALLIGFPSWPKDAAKAERYLRTIVGKARRLEMGGAAAPLAAHTAGSTATVSTASAADSFIKLGQKYYDDAQKVYGVAGSGSLAFDADKRVSYETVGKIARGSLDRRPVAIPLTDFALS